VCIGIIGHGRGGGRETAAAGASVELSDEPRGVSCVALAVRSAAFFCTSSTVQWLAAFVE